MAMQELEWHALEDIDTDGIDENDLRNVADVHEEVDTPVLEAIEPNWVENDAICRECFIYFNKFDQCVTVFFGFLLSVIPECLSKGFVYVCVCVGAFL